MADGSLRDLKRSESPKGTGNVFEFGTTVCVQNTFVRAVTESISQCVRSTASGEGTSIKPRSKKSFGDKAWMPCQMEAFERTIVVDGERRVEVSESHALFRRLQNAYYFRRFNSRTARRVRMEPAPIQLLRFSRPTRLILQHYIQQVRGPVSVASLFQFYMSHLSRPRRDSDVFTKGYDRKRVVSAKALVRRVTTPKNWPSVNMALPSFHLTKCPLSLALVPARNQVF